MPTATTSDNVTIAFETVGDGPSVVLVHGLTDSSATWGPIASALAGRYRVTTLDLRGHGRSGDADDYRSIGMTRDVQAVVAAAGLQNPLVIGHSLGGVVVTAYAAVAPVRGVVNVDQPLRLGAFQAGLQQIESALRDPQSFPAVIQATFDGMNGDHLSDDLKAHVAANRRPRQEVVLGVWDLVFATPVDELEALMQQMTASLRAPYLSLHFMDTPPGYAAWLHRLIPHAVVEEWPPGTGHYGHLIDPDRFVQRVIDFDK